jgi:hypothetical protein
MRITTASHDLIDWSNNGGVDFFGRCLGCGEHRSSSGPCSACWPKRVAGPAVIHTIPTTITYPSVTIPVGVEPLSEGDWTPSK